MVDHFSKRGFSKHAKGPRLTTNEAKRQGRISQMAVLTLGSKAAIAFLNGHDDGLGGRPLDLAIKSEEGLAAAEQALLRRNAES
ncbi:MAG: hypothetical protein M0R03_14375 [Novosphingobium sp.]|nr:hypothetical protein [Novosphingobium sp.]